MLTHDNVIWTCKSLSMSVPVWETDELVSFLPLSHIAERMFSVYMPLHFRYTVNFIESTDTVTENIVEISPTVLFAVPRIWEKYSSAIFIRMKDATWLKRLCFGVALKIGKAFARARLEKEGASAPLRLAFKLVHFAIFNKLKERLGLERVRVAISGAAPISPEVLKFYHAIGVPLRQVYGQTEDTGPTSVI
jgi:long-chain acyl-CoA synthetase